MDPGIPDGQCIPDQQRDAEDPADRCRENEVNGGKEKWLKQYAYWYRKKM